MDSPVFRAGGLNRHERSQLTWFVGVIVLLHAAGWGLVWWASREFPVIVGLAGLAYSFGLRHAFDADHIAAIDNVTRKLMGSATPSTALRPAPSTSLRAGRPFGVGFFFSLGHSTIVLLLTIAIAVATTAVTTRLPELREFGSYLGTTISGVFLYAIGIVNLLVMIDLVRVLRALRRGDYDAAKFEAGLAQRGIVSRWFGRLFRLVTTPRQMYWIGLLFGLGFDTASEVGLLTTAGVAATQSLPLLAVLSLPIVFAAGMTLLDSADGVLMCGAYGWSFDNPLRKISYNLAMTGVSAAVAIFVGTLQIISIWQRLF